MRAIDPRKKWQTIVIHGDSGAGKTSLAATAPRPGFLDSNQGLLSIAGRAGFEHVRSMDVRTMSDLDRAYDNCTGTGRRDWSQKFSTIVFDHWDDIQALILDELTDKAVERDPEREQDKTQQDEYGVMFTKLSRYLRKFKKVPMHKILICSSKPDFETQQMRPNMAGQMKDKLPYFVDHTMYLRRGKGDRRYLHLDATDDFYAKTRAWWLPKEARRIRIDFDDTTALTTLLETIAKGPPKGAKQPPEEEGE